MADPTAHPQTSTLVSVERRGPGARKREKVRRSFCTSTTWMTSLLSSAISDTCNTWRWVYSIKEEEGEEGEEEEEEEDEEEEEEGERKKERKKEMR